MIVATSFFRASSLPKSLFPLADIMGKANECAFRNEHELQLFIDMIEKKFYECTSKMKNARIDCLSVKEHHPIILVFANIKAWSNADIRLYLTHIRGVLDYDAKAKDFFLLEEDEKGGTE